jgi:hypothetical protein
MAVANLHETVIVCIAVLENKNVTKCWIASGTTMD